MLFVLSRKSAIERRISDISVRCSDRCEDA